MLNRSFLLFTLASVNASAAPLASDCFVGKIKTKILQKEEIESYNYCTNSDGSSLLSATCQTEKCPAYAGEKITRDKLNLGPQGTPGFALCLDLGARPQIIEFTLRNGSWVKLDRCLFKDNSFIDTGSLLEVKVKD